RAMPTPAPDHGSFRSGTARYPPRLASIGLHHRNLQVLTPLIPGAIGWAPYLSSTGPRPVSHPSTCRDRIAMGSGVVLGRLAVLLLVFAVLGLPIDDLVAYALLVAAALLVLTGTLSTDRHRWVAAVVVAAAVVAGHVLWAAPRIDEGHNVF